MANLAAVLKQVAQARQGINTVDTKKWLAPLEAACTAFNRIISNNAQHSISHGFIKQGAQPALSFGVVYTRTGFENIKYEDLIALENVDGDIPWGDKAAIRFTPHGLMKPSYKGENIKIGRPESARKAIRNISAAIAKHYPDSHAEIVEIEEKALGHYPAPPKILKHLESILFNVSPTNP